MSKKFQKPSPDAVKRLVLLILVTLAVLLFYRVMMNFYYFEIVMISYMVLSVGFVLAYVIYNRGFSRRGITREMLPEDWSEEQKSEFIEDGENRKKKSRWLLIPIFAFVFTFAIDAIELFVLPFFVGLFTK